jgi:hypothetical protein
MANGGSVNVLRSLHCSETGAGFQLASSDNRSFDALTTVVGGILKLEAKTTGGETV